MATQSRTRLVTLLLSGLTVAVLSLSGCIIDATNTDSASCVDSRHFEVSWEVDTGDGTPMLLCSQTPSSYVRLTTNFSQQLRVDGSCADGTLYNWFGLSVGGLATGTTVVRAELISNADGRQLSVVDVPPSYRVAIGSCSAAAHTFEFPLAP